MRKELTPLAATMMPHGRMDILTESEIQEINSKSKLVKKNTAN
jgi:hypothetical protein